MELKQGLPFDGEEQPKCDQTQPKFQQGCAKFDQYATKNVLVISLCFLLLYTPYAGLQFLQSSLHTEEGLGLIALSVIYVAYAAANLFGLAQVAISLLGHKWTMVVGMSLHLLWMLMNGHATWYTLVPAAFLLGLGGGPLWVAQGAYLTVTAANVGSQGGGDMEIIIHRYFGVFYFAYCLCGLIGPAISSAILHVNYEDIAVYNNSYAATLWSRCGARDCPGNPLNETAIEPQDQHKVWLLVGVYGGCAFLAVIVMALTLDNVPKSTESFSITQIRKLLSSVIRLHGDWRQLLFIPLSLQQGLTLGFVSGDFSKSFGSCVYGVWMAGMVALPFGLARSIMSVAAGGLVKYTGTLFIITAAQVVTVAVLITLLCWSGHGGEYVVYTLACLLGVGDAIRRTVWKGTIPYFFPETAETAFGATIFWEVSAMMISYAYSKHLCTSTKIWVYLVITLLATCSFIILEKPCCTKKTSYGSVTQVEIGLNENRDQCNTSL